eukprot:CAMPEP_0182613916 /NCGR_PEP_ID=MMETSP1330-20130603/27939_1 /TAXON_ID=464278 /ORGANISM="Picochlorum sp., Strain RCC944" /LENGTH=38 /DNA_ID= /DNA_START= /DNA_END= /DNA_ORIENTATION=
MMHGARCAASLNNPRTFASLSPDIPLTTSGADIFKNGT